MRAAVPRLIERVLIVGAGSIGTRHLRIARTLLPSADIRVLRRAASPATPTGANGCFSNLEAAVNYAPHIAVVANPATLHLGVAYRLAHAGTHLLVEKPLAADVEGVSALLQVCRERRVVLLIGYNLRFLPSLQHFRSLVRSGSVGRVLSVRCEIGQYLPSWRPGADYRQSVSARRELGGGALLELSHELDYLRWIFGEVAWVKAFLSRQSSLEIDVEDSAHIILGFAAASDGSQLVGTVNMDFVRHDTTRICTAICESGSIRWNGLTGKVEQFAPGGEWREVFSHSPERDESYLREWRHFLACVNGEQTPLITGEDGLGVMKIVRAARNAAEAVDQKQLVSELGRP
jgi:predicted dehydrogenase